MVKQAKVRHQQTQKRRVDTILVNKHAVGLGRGRTITDQEQSKLSHGQSVRDTGNKLSDYRQAKTVITAQKCKPKQYKTSQRRM